MKNKIQYIIFTNIILFVNLWVLFKIYFIYIFFICLLNGLMFNQDNTININFINETFLYNDLSEEGILMSEYENYYINFIEQIIDIKNIKNKVFSLDILKEFLNDKNFMNGLEEEMDMEIKLCYALKMQEYMIEFVQDLKKENCTLNFYKSVEYILSMLDDLIGKQTETLYDIQLEIHYNLKKSNLWSYHEFHKDVWTLYYDEMLQKLENEMGGSAYFVSRRIGIKLVRDMYYPIIMNNKIECIGSWFLCIVIVMKLLSWSGNGPSELEFPFDNWGRASENFV